MKHYVSSCRPSERARKKKCERKQTWLQNYEFYAMTVRGTVGKSQRDQRWAKLSTAERAAELPLLPVILY